MMTNEMTLTCIAISPENFRDRYVDNYVSFRLEIVKQNKRLHLYISLIENHFFFAALKLKLEV